MAERPRRQQHAVAVPLAAQGHLNPLMRFCKQLAGRGFLITVVIVDPIHRRIEEVKNHREVADPAEAAEEGEALASNVYQTEIGEEVGNQEEGKTTTISGKIRRVCLPIEGFDLSNEFRVSFQPFFEAQNSIGPELEALIIHLNRRGPPVTCLISDVGITLPTQEVADKFNIPRIALYPNSASLQLLVSYVMQGQRTSAKQLLSALKGPKTEVFCDVDMLPGLPSLLNKHLPSFKHVVDDNQFMWWLISQTWQQSESRAHVMVINSFEEFEGPAFKALSENFRLPVYGIGPLVEPVDSETSLWKVDEGCIAWLEEQPPLSVLYISFGSITILSQSQLNEIIAALNSTQQRFVWVFRQDLVEGVTSDSYSSTVDNIVSECEGRGYIVEWAPQLRILSHPSVGGFLTHCGWNSVIEAIAYAVPMLCWPYFADQNLNAMYIVKESQIGLMLESDKGLVERGEIESAITALMVGAEGRTLREKVAFFKELARGTLLPGGSSHGNLEAVIESLQVPKP